MWWLIHLHVPIRLDGPQGPDGPATARRRPGAGPAAGHGDLEDAIKTAAAKVRLDTALLSDGSVDRLRRGSQVDPRSITDVASRDSSRLGRQREV